MRVFLILLLSFCWIDGYGQVEAITNSYSFNLTFTPQLYLNGVDIENDKVTPDGFSAKNTGGFTAGFEIERKSKKGFVLNLGLLYSMRHYSLAMGYKNLDFFLPGAAEQLNTLGPQIEYYRGSIPYFKVRFMAGHVLPFRVLNGCNIEIKGGISSRIYIKRKAAKAEYYRGIVLIKNDTTYDSVIGEGNFNFGATTSSQSYAIAFEWYIGLCRNLNTQFLKNINIGIEMTRALTINGRSTIGEGELRSYTLYDQDYSKPYSYDRYRAKDFSIGLRLSAGLWHK